MFFSINTKFFEIVHSIYSLRERERERGRERERERESWFPNIVKRSKLLNTFFDYVFRYKMNLNIL